MTIRGRHLSLVSVLALSAVLLLSGQALAAGPYQEDGTRFYSDEQALGGLTGHILVMQAQANLTADAGRNETIYVGDKLVFNGSASSPEGLNYTWNFTYRGGQIVLYGIFPSFTFREPGQYVITLTVRDSGNHTATDTTLVAVLSRATWWDENSAAVIILGLMIGGAAIILVRRWHRNHAFVTASEIEKLQLRLRDMRRIWLLYSQNLGGKIGLGILLFFVILALFAPWLITHENPNDITWIEVNDPWLPPSWIDDITDWKYPLGTAEFGKDVYSMTVLGTRASLVVGILASLISIILGASIGIASGYFGKISDEVLMRFTDFFLVIPWFPLMIVFASLLGRSFWNVIIVIGITSWPSTARIVRAQVLSVKEKAFVERARSVGARDGWILQKHIMPNVFPLIFANTILLIANSIFSEAFLDFFGLGDPTVLSWGIMLENAYQQGAFLRFAWWYIAAPGVSIVLLIMAFYLVGDALDEVLNPKLRKR